MAIEVMRFDSYIGFFDNVARKRLANIYPKKKVMIKVKATAFEHGWRWLETTDLHQKLSGRKTVSLSEYHNLVKVYGKR